VLDLLNKLGWSESQGPQSQVAFAVVPRKAVRAIKVHKTPGGAGMVLVCPELYAASRLRLAPLYRQVWQCWGQLHPYIAEGHYLSRMVKVF